MLIRAAKWTRLPSLVTSSLSYILGGRLGPDSESFKGLYQMLQCYSEIGTKAQPLRDSILGRQLPKNILGWSSGESQVVTGLGMDLGGLGRSFSEMPQTIKGRLPFFLPQEAVIACIPILSNHVNPHTCGPSPGFPQSAFYPDSSLNLWIMRNKYLPTLQD